MLIYPAIDLYEGCAVRLKKGDYAQKTIYSENPVEIALDFKQKGVRQMHTVDLEGAKDGTTPNLDLILKIKKESGLFVEVGGGIRSFETIAAYLDAGIDRVILGTAAVADPDFVEEAVKRYEEKIAVGIDIKDGCVAVKGWVESSGVEAGSFMQRMLEKNVRTIICTDISKDGMMQGPNRGLYKELSGRFPEINLIASGGVSCMEDLVRLKELGLYGAIVGKAYYEKAVDLEAAVRMAAE